MEAVATFYNYQLAWTPDKNNCADRSPRAEGKLNWTYCMVQLYTDETQWVYSPSGCSPATDSWAQITSHIWTPFDFIPSDLFWKSHNVPMFCGAGDCQEGAGKDPNQPGICIDERLPPSVRIEESEKKSKLI